MINNLIKKKFDANGYIKIKNLFSKKTCLDAAKWLQKQNQSKLAKSWTEKEPFVPLAVYFAVHNQVNPISKLVKNTELLKIASHLMGDNVYVWSSKVNLKAAWYGTAEYYHQDLVYWKNRGYKNNNMMSAMIVLEPHKKFNSALQVFPGSHKLGFVNHTPFININGLSKFSLDRNLLDQYYLKYGYKTLEADPGDVIFFHAALIHGSSHNISNQGRMIILSQLNSVNNKPINVKKSAIKFNLSRSKKEMEEAKRKYEWFKKKYETQKKTNKLKFLAPIVKEEL